MRDYYEFFLWFITVASIIIIVYEIAIVRTEDKAMKKRKDNDQDLRQWTK